MTATDLRRIPLDQLHESPLNPRKHFDPEALAQLADSLRQSGQLEALLARPTNGGGSFEILSGHRRFRAAKVIGLTELDVRVREIDDATAIEILTIANLQRDDLHPLEEANGFADLMERAGYDVAKIATRTGKSVNYVYDRLKLRALIPPLKKLFLEGRFEAGHAIILARLTPEWQKKALASEHTENGMRMGGLFMPERAHATDQVEFGGFDEEAEKPVSVRELQTWVDRNVRFKPQDADPMLFPDTVQRLAYADEAKLKVVSIVHEFRVPDAARDEEERTYGSEAWERADGFNKSKECAHRVMGVVVAGPGRGDAFSVCVAKKKCTVHWPDEVKAAERAKAAAKAPADPKAKEREAEEERQRVAARAAAELESKRWEKAKPEICKAIAAKLKKAPVTATSDVGKRVLQRHGRAGGWYAPLLKLMPVGKTADDMLRYLAYASIVTDSYNSAQLADAAKEFGVDARRILDAVAPTPRVQTSGTKPSKKARKAK